MPNRIIREAILSSEKMAMLSWAEEVFYRRLLSIVDDHGRYEANPQLLRSKCYPLHTDATVQAKDIAAWLVACQRAGVLQSYTVGGKRYLHVVNFGQQQRTPSKYPEPPALDSNCEQTIGNEHLGVSVFGGVSEGVVVVEGVVATSGGGVPAAPAPAAPPEPPAPAARARTRKPAPPEGEDAPTNAVWRAYATTYAEVHRVDPPRGPQVNALLTRLISAIGREDAIQVAAYYVRSTTLDPFYARTKHPLSTLVAQWPQIHTVWAREQKGLLPDPPLVVGRNGVQHRHSAAAAAIFGPNQNSGDVIDV